MRSRRTRLGRVGAAGLACVLGFAACTTDETYRPQVDLANPSVLADAPLEVTVRGLEPGSRVEVTAAVEGTDEAASATFEAPGDGVVDLAEDAPDSGSYREPSGYGLMWSLRGGVPSDVLATRQRITVTVTVDGQELEPVTQERMLRPDRVQLTRLRAARDGLAGYFFTPPSADLKEPAPAVVVFGGSEGGIAPTAEAQLLASHGYPTLVLGYFKAPGLPRRLERIPLEYFAAALEWVADQPGVDPDLVVPYGISRGSEAALLTAALRPDLAAGAVAVAPSGVAGGSVGDAYEPAWTNRGRPVPYVSTRRQMYYDPGDAVIPVWDIDGPLLLVCGAADRIWPACHQVADVADRLQARDRSAPTVARYEQVGHEIGFLPPGIPVPEWVAGRDPDATGLARVDAWSRLLAYLERLAG